MENDVGAAQLLTVTYYEPWLLGWCRWELAAESQTPGDSAPIIVANVASDTTRYWMCRLAQMLGARDAEAVGKLAANGGPTRVVLRCGRWAWRGRSARGVWTVCGAVGEVSGKVVMHLPESYPFNAVLIHGPLWEARVSGLPPGRQRLEPPLKDASRKIRAVIAKSTATR